jgi:hypothetical protein
LHEWSCHVFQQKTETLPGLKLNREQLPAEFPDSIADGTLKFFRPEDFSSNCEYLCLKMARLPVAK